MSGDAEKKKLPVGISDFKKLVTGNYTYVDKTLFIKEILNRGDDIILLPRPRRFGKTLNLSMLQYFFNNRPDTLHPTLLPPAKKNDTAHNTHLFEPLAIGKAGKKYTDKMGKHPVIFMSFRDIKELKWEYCISKIKKLIQAEYAKHYYLLECKELLPHEKDYFKRIIDLKAGRDDYECSLQKLLIFLHRYFGERVVILVDEYDSPVHAGFTYGYYDEIINFMRNFLGGGLKDTDQYLEKSVLTGIMRIAKESIFSGLNNPGVFTLLSTAFDDKFGFTETEVKALLRDFQYLDRYDTVRDWYNGYRFGDTTIYNPWSIINFLSEGAKQFKPYWINTSDNTIIDTLLSEGGKELKEEMELLIRGDTIEKVIDENIVLKHIDSNDSALWSFLLMAGYLKPISGRMAAATNRMHYTLSIPNREVRTTYATIIDRYFTTKIENKKIDIMLKALIDGDVPLFEKMLRKVVLAVFSYHDFGGEPEKVYHALVAGLLIWITDTHQIKSNRESGYGRYDIMIIPRAPAIKMGKPGYVIEFKTVDRDENESVSDATEAALKQIEEKKYETELLERGIKDIRKLALVFNGKDLHLKEAT
ncbi:MAG: AAA family ATPase [bacterium]|nr:AAA family ATPase [bacterium]